MIIRIGWVWINIFILKIQFVFPLSINIGAYKKNELTTFGGEEGGLKIFTLHKKKKININFVLLYI